MFLALTHFPSSFNIAHLSLVFFLNLNSFYGAQQLSLDFGYVKVWIASDSSNLSSEIQSHLLNLDVFRHLDGAIRLLMLQPRKKKQSPNSSDDPELESNVSTMSSSSVLSSLSGVDIDAYDIDVLNDKTIPNSQKWLDLRLRGGKSKKGLLPFCLKVQEMKWYLVIDVVSKNYSEPWLLFGLILAWQCEEENMILLTCIEHGLTYD